MVNVVQWDLCSQLQDRTQFSDGDLIQLKHYWDRGMTSLGSVCREKINAAATQLGVDTEIVRVTDYCKGHTEEKTANSKKKEAKCLLYLGRTVVGFV